jgi:hypothetical protein
MLAQVLELLSQRIEAAALSWGSFVFDGSDDSKKVTWQAVDADQLRESGLMVGIEYRPIRRLPTIQGPEFVEARGVNANFTTGAFSKMPAMPYPERPLWVHLYMHDTRADVDRVDEMPSVYAVNEAKLIKAIGFEGQQTFFATPPNLATPLAFKTKFEQPIFAPTQGLAMHGIYQWACRYPMTEGEVLTPGKLIRKIHVYSSIPVPDATRTDIAFPSAPGRLTNLP